MKLPLRSNLNVAFALVLALAFLAGLWLRWYLLADQMFGDDEWHGLYYVIGKSPVWLLTHFSIPGATCIPLNFYTWLLGVTSGWSELLLRLPSLVCGLACVVAGPLLAQKFIGPRRAGWLGLLLAISPLLVFYSRICRPYSAVALLAFTALLLGAHWMQSGGLRPALLFIITGTLAIYFHLFAVVTVAVPLLAGFVFLVGKAWAGPVPGGLAGPTLRQWLVVSLVTAGLSALLVLPALIYSLHSTFFTIALKGSFCWQSLPHMAQLISGTGQPMFTVLFWVALIAGAIEQCRRNAWWGWMLVSLYPLHALALVLSRPDSMQSAIVLTRYCIPLVPVSLLLVACGMQTALEALAACIRLQPVLQTTLAVASVAALGMTGPLPQCYVAPNNFTNHGAYQHRYGTLDWQQSFYSDLTPADFTIRTTIRAEEISSFYQQLARQPGRRPVIEYPMMIGDHFNPLYYYQHFHRRPVLVGYATDLSLPRGLGAGNIYGDTYIDQVLSLIHDPARLRFRNMIDMDDVAAMRARGAEYVILHKRFEAQLPLVSPPLPDLERLWNKYDQTLGKPCYEDEHIAVFRL